MPLARGADAVRRGAEAAGPGGAAARLQRGAAAGRAGQLPRRARQGLAGGADHRDTEDRAAGQPRPRAAGPLCRADRHRRGRQRLGARRRLLQLRAGQAGPDRAAGRAAAALGRGAREAEAAGADVPAEGVLQRRYGVAAAGSGYPAGQVRGRGTARAPPARAERADAPARRPDRQAGGDLRGPGADRPHAAGFGRGLVRRAGGRPGLERVGQVVLPAAAGRRADRSHRRRAPRGAGGARSVRADARPAGPGGQDPAGDPQDRACAAGRRGHAALARYELQFTARQRFGTLSGGQQARLQILLLELAGCTLLLLDEPTDNLDLASAEALQAGLDTYSGTVLAVTHDRWFARSFDRFFVFGGSGEVYEAAEPVWDESRVARPR